MSTDRRANPIQFQPPRLFTPPIEYQDPNEYVSNSDETMGSKENPEKIEEEYEEERRKGEDSRGPRKKTVTWFSFTPGEVNAPCFTGVDITDFLEEYDFRAEGAGWIDNLKKQKLPYFCSNEVRKSIVRLPAYRDNSISWEAFQKSLKSEYSQMDSEYRKSTRAYLESWLAEVSIQPIPLNDYYHKFNSHVGAALARSQIVALEVGVLFFRGLGQDDKAMVMHGMPMETRPRGGDVNTYNVEEIYNFLRQCREQDAAIQAAQQEERWVASHLARSEAASLAVPLIPPPAKFFERTTNHGLPSQQKTTQEPDLQVRELIGKMGDLTLTIEEYRQWKASMPTAASILLSKPANDRYVYEKLVSPTLHVERNDGSFKSSYYPIVNPKANTQAIASREYRTPTCRTCGEDGHAIKDCPWRRKLLDNGWYHEIFNTTTRFFDYYYGPRHLRLEQFRGPMPRSQGDAQLQYIIRELKQYFNVSDKDLEGRFEDVPGLEGKLSKQVPGSARSHLGTHKRGGNELSLELDTIRRAEAFYRNLSATENLTAEVNNFEEVNVAGPRGRNHGAPSQHDRVTLDKITGNRMGQPVSIARTKDLRDKRVRVQIPTKEDQPTLSVPHPEIDSDKLLDNVVRQASQDIGLREDQEVTELPRGNKKKGGLTVSAPPSDEELKALITIPNANSILLATLTQEVRGLTVGSLLSQQELYMKAKSILEKDSQQHDKPSKPQIVSLLSGNTFTGQHLGTTSIVSRSWEQPEEPAIITPKELEALNPTLYRHLQEVNAARTNRYTIDEVEDGYQQEMDDINWNGRHRLEKQLQVTSVLAKLPTCFATVMGNHCEALIDSGSELNVMRYTTARALNVFIQDQDQSHLPPEERSGMIGASGTLDEYVGTAYSVPVKIRPVMVPTHFKITKQVRRPIILGTPFAMAARLRMEFTPMGRCTCRITSKDGSRTVSFLGLDSPLLSNCQHAEEDSENE